MYYIYDCDKLFLMELEDDGLANDYPNKTKTRPPFDKYPKKEFNYKFSENSNIWYPILKKRAELEDFYKSKRAKKNSDRFNKDDYILQNGAYVFKDDTILEQDQIKSDDTQD